MRNLAIAEAAQYHLTQRETDIWCLYRANYSYKEIADYLYISINTVKKYEEYSCQATAKFLIKSIYYRHCIYYVNLKKSVNISY